MGEETERYRAGKYEASQFIDGLKEQVAQIVHDVMADNSNRHVTVLTDEQLKSLKSASSRKSSSRNGTPAKKSARKAGAQASDGSMASGGAKGAMAAKGDAPVGSVEEADVVSRLVPDGSLVGKSCPLCGHGIIVKGKAAYGCSRWREGCTFRLPFAHDKA